MSAPEAESTTPRIIYPYAIAVFPILSILSTNIGEARLAEAVIPLFVVSALTLVLYLAFVPILRDPQKRALAVAVIWPPIFAYGPTIDTLRDLFDSRASLVPIVAVVAACAAYAGLIGLLRRTSRRFDGLTRLLNTLGLCAVAVPLVLIAVRTAMVGDSRDPIGRDTPKATAGPSLESYPDIYYFILDAYGRADYLEKVFDHDNGPFLDGLRDRGFYVANESRSNYIFTQMSLASSFNFDYLEDDMAELVSENWDAAIPTLTSMTWNNDTVAFLKGRGYEFVAFSSYVLAADIPSADRIIEPEAGRGITEFQTALIEQTPLRILWNRIDTPRIFPFFFAFDELPKLERGDRPMFVFVHILAPHLPHTVDANGNPYASPVGYIEGYRNEVVYLNKRVTETVDAVLESRPNSVFLIQGDHGPWSDRDPRNPSEQPPWNGTREDYILDRAAILNAYYFPEGGYDELYPTISPVNSFRVVLNRFFDSQYPLLPDKSYIYTVEADDFEVVE